MQRKKLTPATPDLDWMQSYFSSSLTGACGYHIDTPPNVKIKLDQNETPWDWPEDLKQKVLDRVQNRAWQRYPSSFSSEVTNALAEATGVPADCILTANGSNVLISILISTLTQKIKGKVVIARPSFALYESHCQYESIPYEVWPLNANLEYEIGMMPKLTDGSLIIFASPNNPVGNALPYETLDSLLKQNPTSFFLADEAYFEFVDRPFTELLSKHANLILVRTFSKTMGAAGARIGYVVASAPLIREIAKLRLPYLLNNYAVETALEVLQNPELEINRQKAVAFILSERARLTSKLTECAAGQFEVKESHANFLLIKWKNQAQATQAYEALIDRGILIRNVSAAPGLSGCLRATIGTADENQAFLSAMNEIAALQRPVKA
jgi:histidinol-phosphate aminotransferase